MKKCDRCGVTKFADDFDKSERTADGLSVNCIACKVRCKAHRSERILRETAEGIERTLSHQPEALVRHRDTVTAATVWEAQWRATFAGAPRQPVYPSRAPEAAFGRPPAPLTLVLTRTGMADMEQPTATSGKGSGVVASERR